MFTHPAEDRASFRAFTSQLCDMGLCKQADVVRTFKVPKKNVIRAVALYREKGFRGFFESQQPKRKPRVMTAERRTQVQALLNEGLSPRLIGIRLGIKADTIRDNIERGLLSRPQKKTMPEGIRS
ncbi:MAG: hypothetical protein HQL31_09160 [Planctomycetes bacterium]|nr:hypothetical protein [Planctomycetota bacterium]